MEKTNIYGLIIFFSINVKEVTKKKVKTENIDVFGRYQAKQKMREISSKNVQQQKTIDLLNENLLT